MGKFAVFLGEGVLESVGFVVSFSNHQVSAFLLQPLYDWLPGSLASV